RLMLGTIIVIVAIELAQVPIAPAAVMRIVPVLTRPVRPILARFVGPVRRSGPAGPAIFILGPLRLGRAVVAALVRGPPAAAVIVSPVATVEAATVVRAIVAEAALPPATVVVRVMVAEMIAAAAAAFALCVLVPPSFGIVVTEPGCDLVPGAFEKPSVVLRSA